MVTRAERKARRRALSVRRIDWTRYRKLRPYVSLTNDQLNPHTPIGKAVRQWAKHYAYLATTITERLEAPTR